MHSIATQGILAKPIDTRPDIWSMNRSTSAAEEINTWIRKYRLWDETPYSLSASRSKS